VDIDERQLDLKIVDSLEVVDHKDRAEAPKAMRSKLNRHAAKKKFAGSHSSKKKKPVSSRSNKGGVR